MYERTFIPSTTIKIPGVSVTTTDPTNGRLLTYGGLALASWYLLSRRRR